MKSETKIRKTFILQKDQSDCGVACLCSIINYHGGEANQEKIRIASGTSKQGTTLLGLYQVANSMGLKAEGMQGDLAYLKKLSEPAILHVVIDERLQHYVVFYGEKNNLYLIGDPGFGLKWINEEELNNIWKSYKLLTLCPKENEFVKSKSLKKNKWIWFYNLVKEDFTLLTTILVIGTAVAILGLTTAVFSQVFIDNLIPSKDTLRIFLSIGLIAILLFVKSLIAFSRQQLMLKQGFDINIRITGDFLKNLFMLPLPFFTTRKIGDMVARLNDIGRIQQLISFLFGELLINVLVVLVSLIAIFIYDYWIGIVLLTSIPLFGWVAWKSQNPVFSGQQELMAAYALNESNYINTITAIHPIKSFKREILFTNTAISVFEFFQKKILKIGKLGASIHLYSALVNIVITVGVIILSAIQMLNGEMTTGVFMAVFSLSSTILPALATIAFTNIQLQGARVAFERMYEFSSMEKEYDVRIENGKARVAGFDQLRFEKVCFRYPGRKLIIDNFEFALEKGEWITIYGENGAGKSTLISLIQGFLKPDTGKILINGINIEDLSLLSCRKIIGVVPQEISLINATLLANITLSEKESDVKTTKEVLSKYGLLPFFERFPQGFYTMLGDGGIKISGGQKQLVGLARALVHDPKLLLLDEITAHMDRDTEAFVIGLLRKLKPYVGILNITHNLKNAAISDKIVVLSGGKVSAIGSHEKLMDGDNLYSSAWRRLFKTE